jgi:fermentation-respiration switch protein FrsA (DUF1100 family)
MAACQGCIAYDASHQGESGGTTHFLEDPTERVSDVGAVNIGDGARLGWYGKDDPSKQAAAWIRLRSPSRQRQWEGRASTIYVPPVCNANTPKDLAEAHEYYLTPLGQHPNAQNKTLLRSVPLVLSFDAWQFADLLLTQPLLTVVGEKAESAWHSEKLHKLLEGKKRNLNKVVVKDAGHMSLYYVLKDVDQAVQNIVTFFKQTA